MDSLLGNYASDDDHAEKREERKKLQESWPKKEILRLEAISTGNTTSVLSNFQIQQILGQKKRKLLDISILPQHIQKALIHGDSTLGDSDLDDDDNRTKSSAKNDSSSSKNSGTHKDKKTQKDAVSDPLLAMLPAPSQNKEDAMDAIFTLTGKPSNSTKNRDVLVYEKETHDMHQSGSDELIGGDMLEQTCQKPPLMKRQFTSEPDTRDFEYPTPSMDQVYKQYEYQQFNLSAQSYSGGSYQASNGESQRKKQRNLEQMLMNGDLSVLDKAAEVQDIQVGNQQWNALGYSEQKQKEAAIYKQYTSDGALKSAIQPTRQQNRKHQLTSLAMKAAETEIAMLDVHIARSKTKSQTQSRYGW